MSKLVFINGGYMKIKDLKEAIKDLDDNVNVVVNNYIDSDREVSFMLEKQKEGDKVIDFVIIQGV